MWAVYLEDCTEKKKNTVPNIPPIEKYPISIMVND